MTRQNQHNKSGSQSKENTKWPKPDPTSSSYQAHSQYVSDPRANSIGHTHVTQQLGADGVPRPGTKGKSGYPHPFENNEDIESLRIHHSNNSSTEALYEYPVLATAENYNFASKPRDSPGNLRAITNQNFRLKTVVAHDGGRNEKGVFDPNSGNFRTRVEAQQQAGQLSGGKNKKK